MRRASIAVLLVFASAGWADPAPDPLAAYKRFDEPLRSRFVEEYQRDKADALDQAMRAEDRQFRTFAFGRKLSQFNAKQKKAELRARTEAIAAKWAKNDPPYFRELQAANVGEVGFVNFVEVLQVINASTFRARWHGPNGKEDVIVVGLATDQMTDGKAEAVKHLVVVNRAQYTTILGAPKTVPRFDLLLPPIVRE